MLAVLTRRAGYQCSRICLRPVAVPSVPLARALASFAASSRPLHDPQLELLTSLAKWRLDEQAGTLKKTFSFKDSWLGTRFVLCTRDLQTRARRPFTISAPPLAQGIGGKGNKGPPMDVDIVIPAEAADGTMGPEQTALALAIDDEGASLQLSGGWG